MKSLPNGQFDLSKILLGLVLIIFVFVGEKATASWGGCYDLELIAQKTKDVSSNDNNGHRIFLLMNGNTKILLSEGDFGVLDYNGTDGSASFSLPNPDPTNSGETPYSVYIRLVGRPGSKIDMDTCASDATGNLFCSAETISMTRIIGKSNFENVSKELLYIYADINGDGVIDRVPLFSSALQDYFWSVDSSGRTHAQLRFCPGSTTVP